MDTLVERYLLNKDIFLDILQRETLLLSGSSALTCYLEQEGVEAGFEPNDIDLWVSASDRDGEERLVDILRDSGYQIADVKVTNDIYMQRLTHITQVMTMERREIDGLKKIQVIRVTYLKSLMEYVANEFDFSVCMTWWNSVLGQFETIYPHLTLQKKMFVRCSLLSMADSERKRGRLEKYVSRGFTVVDEPPPFLEMPDPRTDEALESWKGVNGFDVFEYDDIVVWEHLKASEWNIVIGVSSSDVSASRGNENKSSCSIWYVFDRKRLCECMAEKRIVDPVWGTMYDTPFRQTIAHDAWDGFYYSDHSIFILVAPEEHPFRGSTKTVYDVEAYSLHGWSQSSVGIIYDKRSQLRLIAESGQEEVKEDGEVGSDQEDLEVIRVIGESLRLSAAVEYDDDEDSLGIHLLNAPVAPVPDIPIRVALGHPPQVNQELWHQLMEWIQVDPPYM